MESNKFFFFVAHICFFLFSGCVFYWDEFWVYGMAGVACRDDSQEIDIWNLYVTLLKKEHDLSSNSIFEFQPAVFQDNIPNNLLVQGPNNIALGWLFRPWLVTCSYICKCCNVHMAHSSIITDPCKSWTTTAKFLSRAQKTGTQFLFARN